MKILPWEYHADLTEDRLVTIAQMIVDGRQAAVERFDEKIGDTGWTLGCCAFEYGRMRILREADLGLYDWLRVVDRSARLIFTIGNVPVRVYRGEADEPTNRTQRQSFLELRQRGFSFGTADEGRDLAYRFAVETDMDGSVLAVKFVGLRGKTAVLNWDVPVEAGFSSGAVGQPATESVELNAPPVGVRERAAKTGV